MAENLSYKPDSGKYWVYDKQQYNFDKYGYLYNWKTAQNVCPTGWHLPTRTDFKKLMSNFAEDTSKVDYELEPSYKTYTMWQIWI